MSINTSVYDIKQFYSVHVASACCSNQSAFQASILLHEELHYFHQIAASGSISNASKGSDLLLANLSKPRADLFFRQEKCFP
jgi:hypothetical protein